jgi:hypothetical protein
MVMRRITSLLQHHLQHRLQEQQHVLWSEEQQQLAGRLAG